MQDEYVEREYQRLKEEAREKARLRHLEKIQKIPQNHADNKTPRSSDESLMGDTPALYNNGRMSRQDEDQFINQIIEPMQAKSKR